MRNVAFLIAAVLLAVLPAFAGAEKLGVTVNPGDVQAGTPPSVALAWVQSTVPTGATCPSGTGSTAITGNNVYRATTAGGEGTTPFAKIATPATTYTDTAVTAGTTYFYKVSAVNCAGESGLSAEVSAAIPNPQVPNAPTGLSVTSVVAGVVIKWNTVAASVPVYYDIMRSVYVPGTTTPTQQINPSHLICNEYLDGTVTAGTRYMYWVRAWESASAISKWSNGVPVVVP